MGGDYNSMTMYVTTNEVITEYKLKPKMFGFTEASDLEAQIERWILQASDAIDKYIDLEIPYTTETLPPVISLACMEAVGNIITNRQLRQDGAYIKSNDWSKGDILPLDILEGVRELLDPLVKQDTRFDHGRIQAYAITSEVLLEDDDDLDDEDW